MQSVGERQSSLAESATSWDVTFISKASPATVCRTVDLGNLLCLLIIQIYAAYYSQDGRIALVFSRMVN